eukprot:5947210-Amphidinium_carterae.1
MKFATVGINKLCGEVAPWCIQELLGEERWRQCVTKTHAHSLSGMFIAGHTHYLPQTGNFFPEYFSQADCTNRANGMH